MKLSKYAKMIEWSLKTHPNCKIFESLSPNQISSKQWMIDELKKHISNDTNHKIEIVGSWYGFPLIEYLQDNIDIEKIECWDIDKEARIITKQYINIFNHSNIHIYDKDYWKHQRNGSECNLLINSSSEHMNNTFADMSVMHKKNNFYVNNPIVVIQSNNMKHLPEHINCVDSQDELINKHKINRVLYSGEIDIVEWEGVKIKKSNHKRFMVIGKI